MLGTCATGTGMEVYTGTGHFGTASIPVPDTSVGSVQHQYRYRTLREVRYDIHTEPDVPVPYLTYPRYISTLPFSYKRFLSYLEKRRTIDGDAWMMRYPVLFPSVRPVRLCTSNSLNYLSHFLYQSGRFTSPNELTACNITNPAYGPISIFLL